MLLADYDRHVLLPEERFRDWARPAASIPESPGHHAEWIAACKSRGRTYCEFAYAGPLTEAVLLGNVAYRAGERVTWDGKGMRVRGSRKADEFLRRRYRRGWRL
jgi:hypothetical protein